MMMWISQFKKQSLLALLLFISHVGVKEIQAREINVPLMPGVTIELDVLRKLSQMIRDSKQAAGVPAYLTSLGLEVVVVSEEVPSAEDKVTAFYRQYLTQYEKTMAEDADAIPDYPRHSVLAFFSPASDPHHPDNWPHKDKDVMVLRDRADVETILHEITHYLINSYFVRNRIGMLHPRIVLRLKMAENQKAISTDVKTTFSTHIDLRNNYLLLIYREEIAVGLVLLQEAQRLHLDHETQVKLQNEIGEQFKALSLKLGHLRTSLYQDYQRADLANEANEALQIIDQTMAKATDELEAMKRETIEVLERLDPPHRALDLFARLGQKAQTFDLDRAKSTYRRLAVKYHPDNNPNDKESETIFKAYDEAWQVLSDPDKLVHYQLIRSAQILQEMRQSESHSRSEELEQASLGWARFISTCIFGGLTCVASEFVVRDVPLFSYLMIPIAGFIFPEIEAYRVARRPKLTPNERGDLYVQSGIFRGFAATACIQAIAMLASP